MDGGKSWSQLKGAIELLSSLRPIPVVPRLHDSEGRVCKRQGIVDLKGRQRGGPCLWRSLGCRHQPVPTEKHIAVRQPYVCHRMSPSTRHSTLEKLASLQHPIRGLLIPKVSSLEIRLVSFQ